MHLQYVYNVSQNSRKLMLASSYTFLQHQSEKVLLKHYSWHHQGYRCSIHRHDTPGCLMSNWSPRHHTEGIPLSDTLKWNWITLNLNKLAHSCGGELDCQQTDSVGQVQWGCIMSTGSKWQMASRSFTRSPNTTRRLLTFLVSQNLPKVNNSSLGRPQLVWISRCQSQ